MKDITIIIPVHKIDDTILTYLKNALASVRENQKNYDNKLRTLIVCINDKDKKRLYKELEEYEFDVLVNNTDKTDYCSQINTAAEFIDTDYFSILEFDDEYTKNQERRRESCGK